MSKYLTLSLLLIFTLLHATCKPNDEPVLVRLTVKAQPEEAGNFSISGDTLIEAGTSIKIEVIPVEGFEFKEWNWANNPTENRIEIIIEEDVDLIADFDTIKHSLTIEKVGEGTVTEEIIMPKTDYNYGNFVRLTAKTDSSWVFLKWEGDVISDEDVIEVEIDSDKEITAIFEKREIEYCIPYSLDVYRRQSETDSLKTLDWDFIIEDRKIVSYEKYYDVTKNGGDELLKHEATLKYSENLLLQLYTVRANNITQYYSFKLNDDHLSEYSSDGGWGSMLNTRSSIINYQDPCGLSSYIQENGLPGNEDFGTTSIDYEYLNTCSTYYIELSDLEISFESNSSSIFKDLEGIPGFMGALYENTLFINQDILLPNKDKKRLSEAKLNFTPGRMELGRVTETYSYHQFIIEEDYPRFFTRKTTYADSDIVDYDTFVVDYKCSYK